MRPLLIAFRMVFLVAAALATASAASVISYRIRSEFHAPLNADQGWAAPLNTSATVHADEPFRIRFEIEHSGGSSGSQQFRLQYRRNGGEWADVEAHDFPHPETESAKTPRISIVACPAYANGSPTTDLLRGSAVTFRPGAGVSLTDRTVAWSATSAHGEFEWALVVRRFADGAVTNEPGDTFELRPIDANGALLSGARPAELRLAVRPGHVGGTFVETPGRIGPWRARNGDLYFIMEPAETSNLFMMIKSADEGHTWREADAANRPPTRDLESVDARQIGDTIHIIHQVTRSTRYHTFHTSDHPTRPDTWAVKAEQAGSAFSIAQATSLAVRSDGSVVAFHVGQTTTHVAVRSPAGSWSEAALIEPAVGPQAMLGASDSVHLAYYNPRDGSVWYRRFLRDGTLTPAEQLTTGLRTTRAEFGSVLPLVFLPQTNTVVILYRSADGMLWERRGVSDRPPTPAVRVTDRPVIQNAVDSQQPGADVVADGTTLHVLFIDHATRSIYSTNDAGGWQPATLRIDKIRGSWVRGNIYTRRDGAKVYGYIYDAGSEGGAGMNRFAEIVLARQAGAVRPPGNPLSP